MIEGEHVPPDCLWGGVMIQEAVSIGMDPCGICPCPNRKRCGGRPRNQAMVAELAKTKPNAELQRITEDGPGARKLIRRQHRKILMGWMDEAIAESGDDGAS